MTDWPKDFPHRIWTHEKAPLRYTILGPSEGSVEWIRKTEYSEILSKWREDSADATNLELNNRQLVEKIAQHTAKITELEQKVKDLEAKLEEMRYKSINKVAEMALLHLETGGEDYYAHGLLNGLRLAEILLSETSEDLTAGYKEFLEMKKEAARSRAAQSTKKEE